MARVLRFVGVCLLASLLAFSPATIARAQPVDEAEPNDLIVFTGDVIVPRGLTVGEVVVVLGTVTVLGSVEGDVIVLEGPVTISGRVAGDVVAIDGRVRLQPSAQIGGGVLAGSTVEVEEGAEVGREIREGVRISLAGPVAALGALLTPLAMAVSTLLLMLVLMLLAPRGVDRLGTVVRTAPFVSAGWGLLLAVLVPVLAVAAVATILGLPLGLAVLLGSGLLFLLGFVAASWGVGRAIVPGSRRGALFAGWGIGAVVGLVPLLNVAMWALGSIFGLGLLAVATWRARGTGKHRLGGVPPETARETPPQSAPLASEQ